MKTRSKQAVYVVVGALWALQGCGASDDLLASNVHGDAGSDLPGSGGALGVGGQPATGGAASAGGTMPTVRGGSPGAGGTPSTGGGMPGSTGGVPGVGGGPGTGSAGGAADCPFENTTIVWGPDGGLRRWVWYASLGPEGFNRWTGDHVSNVISSVESCLPPACTDGVPEFEAIRQALGSIDVQAALAQAPVLYGSDMRPVDGALFEIRVNNEIIDIGTPCWPDFSSCDGVPPGVQALAVALLKLELLAVTGCEPECRPEPRVMRPECSQSGLYVWTGMTCERIVTGWDALGLPCSTPQYYTAEDCIAGHAQCLGLFTRPCGGQAGDTCDADQYCAYAVGYDCARAGAQAVCLPRPSMCAAMLEPMCGCDGQVHGNACSAASSGVGQDTDTACPWGCIADGDCSWQAQYCFEQGGSGVISLTPFCLDDICQCACGHRDATGAFVDDRCD